MLASQRARRLTRAEQSTPRRSTSERPHIPPPLAPPLAPLRSLAPLSRRRRLAFWLDELADCDLEALGAGPLVVFVRNRRFAQHVRAQARRCVVVNNVAKRAREQISAFVARFTALVRAGVAIRREEFQRPVHDFDISDIITWWPGPFAEFLPH